jgi:hypothetical protein
LSVADPLGDVDDLYFRGLDMIEGAPARDPSKTEVAKEEQEIRDQMGMAYEDFYGKRESKLHG